MTEDEERRAMEAWRAAQKAKGERSTGALTLRLQHGCPEGAVRICSQHRWVPMPDVPDLLCSECGLVTARRIG